MTKAVLTKGSIDLGTDLQFQSVQSSQQEVWRYLFRHGAGELHLYLQTEREREWEGEVEEKKREVGEREGLV